jgi:hypothetical protein
MSVRKSFPSEWFLVVAWVSVAPEVALAQIHPQGEEKKDSVPVFFVDTLKVVGRIDDLTGIGITASEGRIGIRDIRLRPIVREGELLETVPGMILTQHSGDGKSNQMFVRGFNLDHGTDFQTRVAGMPINMPTHAHGQGYTDLNFLIPELIEYVEYKQGVYYAEVGDFGSAGGAHFRLPKTLPQTFFKLGGGENGYSRIVGGASTGVGSGDLLIGGEVKGYDGPWEVAQNLRKWSALARYTWHVGGHEVSLLGMSYRNRWESSDQLPKRVVDEGLVSRFGQVDSTLGGQSQRHSLSASWRHIGDSSYQKADVYGLYYDLDLYSNFTYFLDDTLNGDQINQADKRVIVGGNFEHHQQSVLFDRQHLLTLGFQTRADFIDVGLHNTKERQRTGTVREDDVVEWGSGLYLTAESRWGPRFRSLLGLRGDFYLFDVTSDRPENSGNRTDGIITPKVSLMFGPWVSTEFYASAGLGFHSNDARGATQTVDPASGERVEAVDPLVLSRGAEFGLRSTPLHAYRSTLSLWALELDSELLFVGDAGTTEPTGKSQRLGVTWANFYRPIPRLSLDLDVSFTRARYADAPEGEDHIPGALENVVAAGVMWDAVERGPFAAVRLRHFGEYPLTEDNSVRATPTTLINASFGFLFSDIRVSLSVLNLLDSEEDNDIQYFYVSRRPNEPLGGVEDIHFHPVERRQVRFCVSWGF